MSKAQPLKKFQLAKQGENRTILLDEIAKLQVVGESRRFGDLIKATKFSRTTLSKHLDYWKEERLVFKDTAKNYVVVWHYFKDKVGFRRRVMEFAYLKEYFQSSIETARKAITTALSEPARDRWKERYELLLSFIEEDENGKQRIKPGQAEALADFDRQPGSQDELLIGIQHFVWDMNGLLVKCKRIKGDEIQRAKDFGVAEPDINTAHYDKLAIDIAEAIGEFLERRESLTDFMLHHPEASKMWAAIQMQDWEYDSKIGWDKKWEPIWTDMHRRIYKMNQDHRGLTEEDKIRIKDAIFDDAVANLERLRDNLL